MVRPARRRLIETIWIGLLAGLTAAVVMVVATLALRSWLGLPLPVELASDRIVPTLSIGEFNKLARRVGGLVHGKEVAFRVSLIAQFTLAILGGVAFAILAGLLERRARARGAPGRARAWAAMGLAAVLLAVFALEMALLWPVLGSNYRGLRPALARWAAAAGLLVPLALYGVVMVWLSHSLSGAAPATEPASIEPAGPTDHDRSGRPLTRRAALAGAGTVVLGFVGAWLARGLTRRATFGSFGYDGMQTKGPKIDPVTPNDQFYVVTKNLVDPNVADSVWRLSVGGLVGRPQTYRLQDLAALPAVDQPTTLECISNPVGGGLMSNAVWRGVPLRSLLERAGPKPGVTLAVFHAADGYVHTTTLAKAMEPTTLLAYRMNGVPLPARHGYPVRLIVPGTYGEVSVKWVDRIDLVDRPIKGYYEKQGWRAQHVNTTSRIDSPAKGSTVPAGVPVEVRGVAFAGDRGIAMVEVSTDGGASWSPATIEYAPNRLTWALWSFEWRPATPGRFDLTVRATDGTGELQPATDHGPAPAGATGYHRVTVTVGS